MADENSSYSQTTKNYVVKIGSCKKWQADTSREQRAQISDSYHHLQVEGIVDTERQGDAWRKEADKTAAHLTKHCEQTIALVTTKAKDNQDTCELLVSKCQEDAKAAREELEAHRAQVGIDDTRIKILIDKYRQQFNRKIEETMGSAGQEWLAQTVELYVLRADAENRRKEGRGFYKMDETSI